MLKISLIVLSMAAGFAHAEEKTCAVKGMHCEACAESVQHSVCTEGKYKTCDVKVLDENKELGQIHLITQTSEAKVDESAVGAAVKEAGYTLDKCSNGPAKAKKAKKS